MDYQIVVTDIARDDLRSINRYIALDSPDRAIRYVRVLLASVRKLAQFPDFGRPVSEFGRPDLREIVVGRYRIVYRVSHDAKKIEILRFWNGHRGTPEISGT